MDERGRTVAQRYLIQAALGKGGFGAVFRAMDLRLQRPVALKVLHGRQLDAVAEQRFVREARLVQSLTHPNTVRLFDFGRDETETPFIVYELLEGETLAQLVKRGPLSVERTMRIGSQVLGALTEAHQHAIVHRDIKPANVMVIAFQGEELVKLLDFGIAKPLGAAATALTETGVAIGTPAYMSPEQFGGDALTPASDLYSLALVLCEMLSGTRVFVGSPIDICMAQISREPVPLPPAVAASRLAPVLTKALAKQPILRYQNAPEMLRALEQPGLPPTVSFASNLPPTLPQTVPEVRREPERGLSFGMGIAIAAALLLFALTAAAVALIFVLERGGPLFGSAGVRAKEPESEPLPAPELPAVSFSKLRTVMRDDGWELVNQDHDDDATGDFLFKKGELTCIVSYETLATREEAAKESREYSPKVRKLRFETTVLTLVVSSKAGALPTEVKQVQDLLSRELGSAPQDG